MLGALGNISALTKAIGVIPPFYRPGSGGLEMPKIPEIQINGRSEIESSMPYYLLQVPLPLVLGVSLSLPALPSQGQKTYSIAVKSTCFGVSEVWVRILTLTLLYCRRTSLGGNED